MITKIPTRRPNKVWGQAAFVATLALTGLTVASGQSPYFAQQTFP